MDVAYFLNTTHEPFQCWKLKKFLYGKNCFARINYRPVSVLPSFIKILERIIHDRLYIYFTENKIVSEKQFGFRAGHSGDHALD